MSSKLLSEVGEALYGPRWQTELSRDIRVSDRTVRRWAAGTDDVPPGAWRDLYHRLENRVPALDRMKFRLGGLIGARRMTLQPIPNTVPRNEFDGIDFVMATPDGRDVRCSAHRNIFSDRLGSFHPQDALLYFEERSQAFYLAASTKFDVEGPDENGRIVIGSDELIPAVNVL